MTRYNVGEELLVIHFMSVNTGQPELFRSPLRREMETIEKITIKKLTVKEHHRVLNQWANENEVPDCDGFILSDEEGKIWHNQYPRASYGQLSDAGDRMFWSKDGFQEHKKGITGIPLEMRLVTDYAMSLHEGIESFPNDELTPARKELFNCIEKKLKDEFNLMLVEESAFEDVPEIKCFVLKEATV